MSREARFVAQGEAYREPAQVVSHWEEAGALARGELRSRVSGPFWETLDRLRITLFVTREYEHLVLALSVRSGRPQVTYLRLPHPSGVVVDRERRHVHLASTRNPNQIFTLAPVRSLERRGDRKPARLSDRPLVPVASRFYPGCTYLHDLALVGGRLHANAVGENAVVRLEPEGGLRRVWWPLSIEERRGPAFDRNYLQLNSIAAGATLAESFFSASSEAPSRRRPGHRDFPVDRRGVIFSGRTREPVVRGLTRPHSARLHRGRLWVANSGYGELGVASEGRFEPVARLRGWTRGLAFCRGFAFVGTSRVLPRFRQYAPGLDADRSRCAVEILDAETGASVARLAWPEGNQIFGIDWAPRSAVTGLPFSPRRRGGSEEAKRLFYAFHREPESSRRRQDPS